MFNTGMIEATINWNWTGIAGMGSEFVGIFESEEEAENYVSDLYGEYAVEYLDCEPERKS